MIKENTKAPIFKLPSTNKKEYSLKDSIGNYVIIYFYPKDDTPGCTIETNDFNKLLPKFKKLNCEILGISKDNLKSHDKFKDKYKIKFDLLADEEIKVLKNDDYITLPGWDQSTFGTDDYSKLPINAVKYIKFLEEELNVEISIISTGPERNQTIFKS